MGTAEPKAINPMQRRRLKETEAAERIDQDDKLEEPFKIDAMAKLRHWFSGNTSILDAYITGDVDASTTAAKLAEPIEEAYSTADHGAALYNEEMTARNQRTHWSPEEALENWGPEQDFPKPSLQIASLPSTEGQLWDLWYAVLHAAKRIPWTDSAQQNKLLDLVKAFKARPDPPPPSPMTTPLKRNWIWESGTLWSNLSMLGPSARESWNDACGYGSGWTNTEQHAWTNVNAFVARLTASETSDFDNYAVGALSGALEDEIQHSSLHHDASNLIQLSLLLTVASVWIQIAGKHLYERHIGDEESGQVDFEIDLAARGKTLPWNQSVDGPSFSNARWDFWHRRFCSRGAKRGVVR
ncbi:hypothetical protein E0Z10_g3466 [Xylaria hypoxylon]|uniref:Uncharacterized protein n=1 Tax=Xylaria hypoxylon TaxID=37992 RepID=A0A4Z0Z9R1_9PEZI|nr:hypothetical protein E0Z10_g3466 [Xylaria hypoxylon]